MVSIGTALLQVFEAALEGLLEHIGDDEAGEYERLDLAELGLRELGDEGEKLSLLPPLNATFKFFLSFAFSSFNWWISLSSLITIASCSFSISLMISSEDILRKDCDVGVRTWGGVSWRGVVTGDLFFLALVTTAFLVFETGGTLKLSFCRPLVLAFSLVIGSSYSSSLSVTTATPLEKSFGSTREFEEKDEDKEELSPLFCDDFKSNENSFLYNTTPVGCDLDIE